VLSNPKSQRWVSLLEENLATANTLFACSREQFLNDSTLQLAGEALVMRVGDLAKQLHGIEPALRENPVWQSAARSRDFVAHHYHRVDVELLWETLSVSFPELARELNRVTERSSGRNDS
jgi:uncharacterized protein with HEPN domain